MNYCVVFIYKPTNTVGRVWTTFETRAEAVRFAEARLSPGYSYEVRALLKKADWPETAAVVTELERVAG